MLINIANIKPFVQRTEDLGGPQEEPPEPVIIDGQECHEVEAILAEREVRRQRQVLVKWAGYDILNASWEPRASMPQAVLDEWEAAQKDAAPLLLDG